MFNPRYTRGRSLTIREMQQNLMLLQRLEADTMQEELELFVDMKKSHMQGGGLSALQDQAMQGADYNQLKQFIDGKKTHWTRSPIAQRSALARKACNGRKRGSS